MEMEPGEGKAHEMKESPEQEVREGSEAQEGEYGKNAKKGKTKRTKATKDGAGCGCGPKAKGKCDGSCNGARKMDALTPQEYLSACELGIHTRSRPYIRARLDAAERLDLKCGKGAISQGEKCIEGPATQAKGPNALVQAGQAAKGVGRGALELVKWTSGYNIGKFITTGATAGQNEKGSGGSKFGSVLGSTLVLGPAAGLGAARRAGLFGSTDLQQHAKNEKKEKAWRRSVGYRDGGTYAKGFKVDFDQLAL